MKKKLIIGSVLAVLMLVTISFAAAVSSETNSVENKDSPLFGIRTDMAINNNVDELSSSYIGEDKEVAILLPETGNEISSQLTIYGSPAQTNWCFATECGRTCDSGILCGYTSDVGLCFSVIRPICWDAINVEYLENSPYQNPS